MSAPNINDASFRRMDSQSSFSLNPLFSSDSSLTFYGYGSTSTLSLGVRCRDACDEWTSGGDTRRPRDPASNTSFLSPFPRLFPQEAGGRRSASSCSAWVDGWVKGCGCFGKRGASDALFPSILILEPRKLELIR